MNQTRRQIFFSLGIFPLIFLLTFYALPLGIIFQKAIEAFQGSFGSDLFTRISAPLGFTLFQAILSTLLTILVGFPIAYVFSHFSFRGKRFFQIAVTLPFILPTVVVAAAFNSLLGANGWLNLLFMHVFTLVDPPIQLMNTIWIILLAHVFYNTSIFVRMVGAGWAQLEIEQEQAARVLGASPWQRFYHITLPLLKPSIVSAFLMVFLFDFTSFGVILLLGGPAFSTLEVEIYRQTTQLLNLPLAGLLSILQLLMTFIISLLSMRDKKSGVVSFLPDINSERLRRPTGRYQKIMISILLVCLVLFFVLPEVGLIMRSVVKLEADRTQLGAYQTGFTLTYYRELFKNTRRSLFYVPPIEALKNSLLYALATMLVAGILGISAANALVQMRRAKWLRALLVLPLGTSSVTLGLGFLLTFTRLSFFQQFPQVLIPIAHSLVALPVVINTLYPALSTIPANMHAAASNLGASPLRTLQMIDLPLIRKPLLVGALYAFILSLGEFGATSFLTRPDYPTMPIAIYRYLGLPGALNYGQAMAMACILLTVCAAAMFIMEGLTNKDRE